MELGRSGRTLMMMFAAAAAAPAAMVSSAARASAARFSYGVVAKRAALKDQQKRGGVNLNGAYFPRVRAEPSDALRQQTDPLEPAGRRFANLRQ